MNRDRTMRSDLEIARQAELKHCHEIAAGMGLEPEDLDLYGSPHVAKLRLEVLDRLRDRPDYEVHRRHGRHAHTFGRGKVHDHSGSGSGHEASGQALGRGAAPTFHGADLRHQGRRGRRRIFPGGPDGDLQPAFNRRHSRRGGSQQSAGGHDRQSAVARQSPGYRPGQHHLAARAGHE